MLRRLRIAMSEFVALVAVVRHCQLPPGRRRRRANAAVPEPATLVLMFAAAGLRARRGRAVELKCQKRMRA